MNNPSISVTVFTRMEAWRADQEKRIGVTIHFTARAHVAFALYGLGEWLETRLDAVAMYAAEAKEKDPTLDAVVFDYQSGEPGSRVNPTLYRLTKLEGVPSAW